MPLSLTSIQKKQLATVWAAAVQTPIQFALVAAPEPVLWLFRKREDAATALKVLQHLGRELTGFKGTTVTVGRLTLSEGTLRVLPDPKRRTGPVLAESAFVKAWRAGAKLAGLDRLAQLIDKAEFGEEEEEEQGGGTDSTGTSETEPEVVVPGAPVIARAKARWNDVRSDAGQELTKLLKAIRADEELGDSPAVTRKVSQLEGQGWRLDAFDDRLLTALDALADASDNATKKAALTRCRALVQGYKAVVANDPVLVEIDGNPFTSVRVRAALQGGLADIEQALTV